MGGIYCEAGTEKGFSRNRRGLGETSTEVIDSGKIGLKKKRNGWLLVSLFVQFWQMKWMAWNGKR